MARKPARDTSDEPAPLMLARMKLVRIGDRDCIEYTNRDGERMARPIQRKKPKLSAHERRAARLCGWLQSVPGIMRAFVWAPPLSLKIEGPLKTGGPQAAIDEHFRDAGLPPLKWGNVLESSMSRAVGQFTTFFIWQVICDLPDLPAPPRKTNRPPMVKGK